MSKLKMNHSKIQDVITDLAEELVTWKTIAILLLATLTLCVIAGITALTTIEISSHSMADYNKGVCAVYGYQADCKTPLEAK